MRDNTVHILLVDDDDIDAEAVRRALKKYKIANPVRWVSNGIEALRALRGQSEQESLPRPYLVLLDLNMPRMNGLEFLETLRADEDLKDSIVFVLTGSDATRDKIQAYRLNVAGYLVKSRVGEDFVNLVHMLNHYWRIVEFPP